MDDRKRNLFRAMAPAPLLRAAGDGGPRVMAGHFAVFDQWTHIRSFFEGDFMERFVSGAFKKTIDEGRQRVLFQHGRDYATGMKPLGAVDTLREDETGAYYEVPLFDTGYVRELIPGLEAGQYGASFQFDALREDWNQKPKPSEMNPAGLPERTVKEARVVEFGPVTFPAYAGASAGMLRSLTDEFRREELAGDPARMRALEEFLAQSLKTLPTAIAPAPGAARTRTPGPRAAVISREAFVAKLNQHTKGRA